MKAHLPGDKLLKWQQRRMFQLFPVQPVSARRSGAVTASDYWSSRKLCSLVQGR